MRILKYAHELGHEKTPFIYAHIKHLHDLGHEVYFLCHKKKPHPVQDYCKTIVYPWKEQPWKQRLKKLLFQKDVLYTEKNKNFESFLEVAIKDIQPDLIHAHFAYEAIRLYQNLPHWNKTPFLIHFHGYGLSPLLKKKSYRKIIRIALNTSHIHGISASDSIIQNLRDFDLSTFNIKRINDGIDTEEYQPSPPAKLVQSKHIILQISSLNPKKGHDYFIKALAKYIHKNPNTNIQYRYSGTGPRAVEIALLIKELNISHYCINLGDLSRAEVVQELNEAHCFVHPSITDSNQDEEAIPNAIKEAMAMQLPILTTNHGGIPEIVSHKVNGIVVKEKSVNALTAGISQIITWPKLEGNRTKIITQFSIAQQMELMDQVFKDILK